jgi:uncharacterized protein (DUF1501 family)
MVSGMKRMFLTNALAQPLGPTDYKALVCIFLFGGNDANNIVIPDTDYADYDAIRGGSVGLAIPQGDLLPIAPPSHSPKTYGLHPTLTGLHNLWNQGSVAIAVNTGTLVRPITRDEYRAGIGRPYQLFSHSDQQTSWQTSVGGGHAGSGWGGRLADRLAGNQRFPVVTSLSGVTIFSNGRLKRPLIINDSRTRLDQVLLLSRRDATSMRDLSQLVALDLGKGSATLVSANATVVDDALNISRDLQDQGNPTLDTVFPRTGLGYQLEQIAKVIKIAPNLTGGVQRQVFLASMGGFDTHNNQVAGQVNLWTQVSEAMAAFYAATVELGVSSKVTSFTMSDFGRTLKPANPGGNVGTDHAWGSHHFVMGDAVNGGDFYGTYPSFALGAEDDADDGSGARGRFVPTQSVDQYAATMATWYGLQPGDLEYVFPNISQFATSDLCFMNPGTCQAAKKSPKRGLLSQVLGT